MTINMNKCETPLGQTHRMWMWSFNLHTII